MHTPMTDEEFAEPPEEANLPRGTVKGLAIAKGTRWLAMRCRSLPSITGSLLEDVRFRRGMAAPSI